MLLTYRYDIFTIPHPSTCMIHTTGKIKDGDMITITSPVFASTNFTTRSVSMSDRFDVIVRVSDPTKVFVNDKVDGECKGTLVCDDNDVFHMYVRV